MAIETLTVNVADAGEDVLVTCEGELDLASAERFRTATDRVLALHPERMHLDCSGVTFIDSIGIKSMLHVASASRTKGISLTVSTNPTLRRLFDTIGVSGFFNPGS